MADVELKGGFDELIRALDKADSLFLPLASEAMAISLTAIEEEIAPYPPQPPRNRSKHFNTYVRGQGFYPRSSFVADKTEPGGYRIKKTPRGKIRLVSQQMDKKFKSNVKFTGNAITGELKNEAGYSGYVIGSKTEDPKQTDFHAATGWQNKEDAIAAATPKIIQSLNTAIDKFLARLAGK